MDTKKLIIRTGKTTLSFTTVDATDTERPIVYNLYPVRGGVSMPANLREAFKTIDLTGVDSRRVQVVVDSPSMLVPTEQFEEEHIETVFSHTFPQDEARRSILYNVLPSLKTVCLFAVSRDLQTVLTDRFPDAQFIQVMAPVWNHLHQRSYTGHRNKLYAYFHDRRLDIFSFQKNRFKFCNSFETNHAHDALYFLLYVWNQLRLDAEHDELHLAGSIPEADWMTGELKQYIRSAHVINPSADLQQAPATKVKGLPYDLMTLITKGR